MGEESSAEPYAPESGKVATETGFRQPFDSLAGHPGCILRRVRSLFLVVAAAISAACSASPRRESGVDTLVVFAAASLARPLGAALDSFAASGGNPTRLVIGGSLDLARRITEMDERPDFVVLADEHILTRLLGVDYATWYARFGKNRLVLARAHETRGDAPDSASWLAEITRPDVEVARADPSRAPVGYRTLLAWQLAERRLARPGLAKRLEARAPLRHVRGSEAEVLALVATGSADYGWVYESSARAAGLEIVRLPSWMDFGDTRQSVWYASESLSIAGLLPTDSLFVRGDPIVYVFTVPVASPHPAASEKLSEFLLGARGRAALASAGLDVIERREIVQLRNP